MQNRISVFIADDHPVFREGLERILSKEKSFVITGVAGHGGEALAFIRKNKPDVAVLDISMPGMTGIEVIRQVHDEEISTHPVILTMYPEEELLDEALENGVTGYLLKDSTALEIIDCIKTVVGGGYYISKALLQSMATRQKRKKSADGLVEKLARLTPAELQVLHLLAQNKTSTQIAKELFVSVKTVKNHRVNITAKLDLHGYNALLQFALTHGPEIGKE